MSTDATCQEHEVGAPFVYESKDEIRLTMSDVFESR